VIYLHVGAGAQAALSQAILFWLVAVRDMLCTGFQAEPEAGYGSQEETAMLSTANAVRFKMTVGRRESDARRLSRRQGR